MLLKLLTTFGTWGLPRVIVSACSELASNLLIDCEQLVDGLANFRKIVFTLLD